MRLTSPVGEVDYEERVSSRRTDAVWVGLTIIFLALLVWRTTTTGFGILATVFFCLFCLFLFYALNYRTLIIRMTADSLVLRFGVFRWVVPWHTIENCSLDDTSMWRIGGAGIHFTMIRKRYRVFLNFLEHPRVVLALKERRGSVWDIAFSTRQPEEVVGAVSGRIGENT
jgi:hypothetical protein